jgi:hypothetical protein
MSIALSGGPCRPESIDAHDERTGKMRFDMAPFGAPNGVHASPTDARPIVIDDNPAVAVLRWPQDEHQRALLQSRRRPRLLLIAAGTAAPLPSDELEDWTRAAPGSTEFDARISTLRRRSRPAPPDVRLSGRCLQRGSRAVSLTMAQCVTVAPLLRLHGRPVPRSIITDALANTGVTPDAAAVRVALTRLDRVVEPLGLRVWLLGGQGVLLEVLPIPN